MSTDRQTMNQKAEAWKVTYGPKWKCGQSPQLEKLGELIFPPEATIEEMEHGLRHAFPLATNCRLLGFGSGCRTLGDECPAIGNGPIQPSLPPSEETVEESKKKGKEGSAAETAPTSNNLSHRFTPSALAMASRRILIVATSLLVMPGS